MSSWNWRVWRPTATDHKAVGLYSKPAGDISRSQGLAEDRKVGVLTNPHLISEADMSTHADPAVWARRGYHSVRHCFIPMSARASSAFCECIYIWERTREVLHGTGFVFEAKMNHVVLIQGVRRLSGSK
jgi:hypothetical protein